MSKYGLTAYKNGEEINFSIIIDKNDILSVNGNVKEEYKNAIIELKNLTRFYGFVALNNDLEYQIFPESLEKIVDVLSYLNYSATLIDENELSATEGKYIFVNLNSEQEIKLNELKALCTQ
ncbi:MAG: hypothetical protein IJ398_02000 [Clostridia bacterium]|nr:hypothetical protein [Clostridia bacterium]